MGEKSRQHYVPKFYLRNFSNSKKAIDTFNISNSKYIPNASIKDMCQKNNFYGSDKEVENFLNEDVESPASPVIKNMIDHFELPKTEVDYITLVKFILVSETRNLRAADSTNNMVDYFAKTLIKNHPEFKDDLDLDKFTISWNEPVNHLIDFAIESIPLVLDLEPILLVEKTGARRFLTSDNPVVRYNSLYMLKKYNRGFGYATRGLQLFLPISPHVCLLLYDKLAYDIPGVKNNMLTLTRAKDVDQLNEFFYLNAYNNIFFNQTTKESYIESLHKKNSHKPKISEFEREISTVKSINSESEFITISHNKVAKHFRFPWLRVSRFANNLKFPSHMGGLNRMEYHKIRELIRTRNAKYKIEL